MYRIDALLKLDRKTFHTQDLALLWGISNKNTLYTTIKRYIKKGVLIPIHKGFYSTVPLDRLDVFTLGIGYLHRFAYVSLETILAKDGYISQTVYPVTLVSDVSKKFRLNNQDYIVRKLSDRLLYSSAGLSNVNGVLIANTKRALSDMRYLKPEFHFDR